ncbi:hypothetical protein GGS26DRAFT_587030 [Hypomontagnella submonticulosa]|nr:hypothetical protein GGS26DRAFT_587030 [Hypomontagnella submonticulosa]
MAVLRKCSIAISGNLGDQWTDINIARWCSHNGAKFTYDVEEDTTHVLATPKQYKERAHNIKEALKNKKIHIVTKDWFEDSLIKKKKLDEESYSLRVGEKKEKAKQKRLMKEKKGIAQAENFINTNLYHVYRDETFFPYEIVLTRDDEENGYIGQKYVLCLWESNAWPHLYQFTVKFYKKAGYNRPAIYRPQETPGLFKSAFEDFKLFFSKKTDLDWDDRIRKANSTFYTRFQYQPPTGGKPVGVLPPPPPPPPAWSIFGNGHESAATACTSEKRKRTDDDDVEGPGAAKRCRGEETTSVHPGLATTSVSSPKLERADPIFNSQSAPELGVRSPEEDEVATEDEAKGVDFTSYLRLPYRIAEFPLNKCNKMSLQKGREPAESNRGLEDSLTASASS